MKVIPNGAQQIINARKRKQRPDEMLIVSLVGPTGEANHTIFANPDGDYDWQFLRGLDVCIYLRSGVKWKPVAMDIAMVRPRWLGLWDVDRFVGFDASALPDVRDIEKPKDQWRWNLDLLPWLPFQNKEFAWDE